MKVKVSDYIADFFANNGVKHVFTVTGGGAMHLNDSLGHHKKLKCIYNHHEQASAIAADGYARLSGKIPLVCVTSGPGGTNTLTGVVGCWLDSIPMFVISGQVKRATTVWSTNLPLRQLGDQEYNIVDSVKPMSKYAVMVTDPNEIGYHLEKAMYLCRHGRPGPVWLDIPLDVQAALIETENLKKYDQSEDADQLPAKVSRETLQAMLAKIKAAKRPVLLAGEAIRIAGVYDGFLKLIDKLNIPVVTAWNAHDTLWDDHRLYCGRPGSVGTRGGNFVVQNSDLLISFGCRLNIRQISYNWNSFAQNAYKIMIDIDEAELKKPTVKLDMPIHADIKDVVNGLNEMEFENNSEDHKVWLNWCRNVNKKYPAVLPSFYKKQSPVNPYVFMDRLFKNLEENETVITGNGSACVISFQAAEIKKGQRIFTNSGAASMGYGLPAAMGACVSQGNKRVICLDGDGSIQMNIQELQTIVHNQINLKIFWLNNSGYHSIRQTQTNIFHGNFAGVDKGSGISFPDAEKIAGAYGIPFFRIDTVEGIDEIIKKAVNTEGPVLCEAVLDPDQFFEPKLSSKVLPDGSIVSPPIDDMYPFLSREEYDSCKLVKE